MLFEKEKFIRALFNYANGKIHPIRTRSIVFMNKPYRRSVKFVDGPFCQSHINTFYVFTHLDPHKNVNYELHSSSVGHTAIMYDLFEVMVVNILKNLPKYQKDMWVKDLYYDAFLIVHKFVTDPTNLEDIKNIFSKFNAKLDIDTYVSMLHASYQELTVPKKGPGYSSLKEKFNSITIEDMVDVKLTEFIKNDKFNLSLSNLTDQDSIKSSEYETYVLNLAGETFRLKRGGSLVEKNALGFLAYREPMASSNGFNFKEFLSRSTIDIGLIGKRINIEAKLNYGA